MEINMKIAIKTKIIHTLEFYPTEQHAIHGIFALSQIISEIYKLPEICNLGESYQGIYHIGLNNISPEVLTDWDYQIIENIKINNCVHLGDLRTVVQDLINREYLPAGDYQIKI
jgi:hypothetical protein